MVPGFVVVVLERDVVVPVPGLCVVVVPPPEAPGRIVVVDPTAWVVVVVDGWVVVVVEVVVVDVEVGDVVVVLTGTAPGM